MKRIVIIGTATKIRKQGLGKESVTFVSNRDVKNNQIFPVFSKQSTTKEFGIHKISQKTMINESKRNKIKKGEKMMFPIIPSGAIGNPQQTKIGKEISIREN